MALLHLDSFYYDDDNTANLRWQYNTFTYGGTTNARRTGAPNALLTSSAYRLAKYLPDGTETVIIGFACRSETASWGTLRYFLYLRTGWLASSSDQCGIYINASENIEFKVGTATIGSASASPMPTQTWFYFEMKVRIHPTLGSYEVRINGSTVISGSNVDTQNIANKFADMVVINSRRTANSDGVNTGLRICDLYICDGTGSAPYNDFLGDCRVDVLYPTAEGTTNDMAPSSGTDNSALVDDAIPSETSGDTDYVTGDTGERDIYVMGDLSHYPTTIFGVQANSLVKKIGDGDVTVKPCLRVGGTNYDSSKILLPRADDYYMLSDIWTQNPATSASWLRAAVNGAEAGLVVD
jgi:hypothetical protein